MNPERTQLTAPDPWPELITVIRYDDGGFSATVAIPPEGAKFAEVYVRRASVAAVEGDSDIRKLLKPEAWHCRTCGERFKHEGDSYSCEQCQRTWPAQNIVLFGYADLTDESFAAASSPAPAELPPCERCADDANYLPAYYDEEVKLWLHRDRSNEGYLCRLKHPNGLAEPLQPTGEQESKL